MCYICGAQSEFAPLRRVTYRHACAAHRVLCHVVQAVLEEQLSESQELSGAHFRLKHMSVIPDALYMVEDKEYAASLPPPAHIPSSSSTVDIIAGTIPGECETAS